MGLVEGNSTNTVNTVGDTTDESSNEKKGIEIVTTTFCNSNDKEVCYDGKWALMVILNLKFILGN